MLECNESNNLKIEFPPVIAGTYSLSLQKMFEEVAGSPFEFEIFERSKNEPVEPEVLAVDAGKVTIDTSGR